VAAVAAVAEPEPSSPETPGDHMAELCRKLALEAMGYWSGMGWMGYAGIFAAKKLRLQRKRTVKLPEGIFDVFLL